jgi:3'(2'), 5'-bisphosphate nucleotidase
MIVGKGLGKLDKEDRSPVTIADFGAQAVICHLIGETLPGDVIIAEEDSAALRETANASQLSAVTHFVSGQIGETSEEMICGWIDRGRGAPGERFWVLDPIDGTKGFLRHDQYAIALALIEHGEVQWGFLACPVLPYVGGIGVIFVAQHNGGTEMLTLDGMSLGPAWVSDVTNPVHACLAESVEFGHTNWGLSAQLREVLGITKAPIRMDSQAKYAAMARGQADIYLRAPNPRTPDYREHIWDHAAGWLVVTEAGGRVTDVYGDSLDWTQGRRLEKNLGIAATNRHLHDAVIDALAPLLPPR